MAKNVPAIKLILGISSSLVPLAAKAMLAAAAAYVTAHTAVDNPPSEICIDAPLIPAQNTQFLFSRIIYYFLI